MNKIVHNSSSYTCIKKAELSHGVLRGSGYALADPLSVKDGGIEFSFSLSNNLDISFVFGVRGIGNHYRLNASKQYNRFILTRFKDGIPVYLQHAIIKWSCQDKIRILWNSTSIRVYINENCFINVLSDGIIDGRWGFAGAMQSCQLPEVFLHLLSDDQYEWIVLGDGYSNNRWKERHFHSWPELAFGDKFRYLNACVAAGNTRRVQEIIEMIGTSFAGCKVIVAAGADDVMEGEPLQEVIGRLRSIISRISNHGATEVHLSTLVPKPGYHETVNALNIQIHTSLRTGCDSILDFHHVLSLNTENLLVHGDFPGTQAQRLMANCVLDHFHITGGLSPLADLAPRRCLNGTSARAAARLSSWLNNAIGHF
jgi:hypothetical protein